MVSGAEVGTEGLPGDEIGNSGPSGRKFDDSLAGLVVTGGPVGAKKTPRAAGITDAIARGAEGTGIIFGPEIGNCGLLDGTEE